MELMLEPWITEQLISRGIRNTRILQAMADVPRERFVPPAFRQFAYDDRPLPIGYEQTISQAFVVAYMTALLNPQLSDRILEIGTGSGYQAAILAELCAEVCSVEVLSPLAEQAAFTLHEQGYDNVLVRHSDGFDGWQARAPFDGIILTAAPKVIPAPLLQQLAEGGRLVAPIGSRWNQVIVSYRKKGTALKREEFMPVRFVPMVHAALAVG